MLRFRKARDDQSDEVIGELGEWNYIWESGSIAFVKNERKEGRLRLLLKRRVLLSWIWEYFDPPAEVMERLLSALQHDVSRRRS